QRVGQRCPRRAVRNGPWLGLRLPGFQHHLEGRHMSGGRTRTVAVVTAALAALVVPACAPAAPAPARGAAARTGRILSGPQHPALAQAIARGHDAGPLAPGTLLRFTLGLAPRNAAGLDAALASGRRLGAAEYT